MHTHNKVSVSIPADILNAAKEKLQEVSALLAPYLQSLTPNERRTLPKMSEKTLSFVVKTQGYSITKSGFAPGMMDVEVLAKDAALVNTLAPLDNLAEDLARNINNTMLLAASEAYNIGLLYYSSVRVAALSGVAGARPIYNDLRLRVTNHHGINKAARQ